MKDNLFEMLMNLFETSLAQLQQSQKVIANDASRETEELNPEDQAV